MRSRDESSFLFWIFLFSFLWLGCEIGPLIFFPPLLAENRIEWDLKKGNLK